MAAHKPPIPVGDWKAAQHGAYNGTSWVNVFYGTADAAGHTPGQVIAAIASWIEDFYNTAMGHGGFNASWSTDYVTVTYRDAADSTVRVKVADAVLGTGGAGGQDAQVCWLINWSTGDPRKGGKPRTYVTDVADGFVLDAARLQPTEVTARNGRIATWLVSQLSAAIPLQLVEMSFRDGNTWRDAAHTYPILGGTVNPVVATQRRRVDRERPS